MEHTHEFGQGMLATYAKLEKAFQSVHREALWDILQTLLFYWLGFTVGLKVKCGWDVFIWVKKYIVCAVLYKHVIQIHHFGQ